MHVYITIRNPVDRDVNQCFRLSVKHVLDDIPGLIDEP